MKRSLLIEAACLLAVSLPCRAAADVVAGSGEAGRWVIEATGTASAKPDIYHILMKMDYEAGLAAEAAAAGEKRLAEFLAAVDQLGIAGLTYRVWNNVITPSAGQMAGMPGLVYTRNIVFTLEGPLDPGKRDATVARLEDLGARYNSHCVTCIGSG